MSTFRGLYAAALTPRRVNSSLIDLASYWELLDFLASRKVDGVVLMGATGEFVHFPLEERIKYLGLTVKRCRVPVLVNVTHSTLDGSLEIADAAARAGVAGILIMPPYFFRYDQAQIRLWFEEFAKEKPKKLPTLLYNIPVFSNPLEPGTVVDLLESGCYSGIKDSSGEWSFFTAVRDGMAGRESSFLVGNDRLIARACVDGAHGAISGVACAVPELLVALQRSMKANDAAAIAKLEARLNEFIDRIDALPTPIGIREALRCRDMNVGPSALPVDTGEFLEWFKPWLRTVLSEHCVA